MAQLGHSDTFQHQNGHVSGLAHYGDQNGQPVFYFHGLPSSRLEGAVLHEAAERVSAHIIAVDRPGVGLSSVMPQRRLLSWPSIVLELAEHFHLEQFYVLGSSAGGPYALACAREIPSDKLKGVGVIAGMGPVALGLGGMSLVSKFSIYATKAVPWIGRKLFDWAVVPAAQDTNPAAFGKLLTDGFSQLNATDKRLFEDEQVKDRFVQAGREHFRQGSVGLPDEWRNFVSDWGFDLKSIKHDHVLFWCGTEDSICPVELSRRMAAQIEGSKLAEFEGGTHYSVVIEKGEYILSELLK